VLTISGQIGRANIYSSVRRIAGLGLFLESVDPPQSFRVDATYLFHLLHYAGCGKGVSGSKKYIGHS
jgi:hypothetical protein